MVGVGVCLSMFNNTPLNLPDIKNIINNKGVSMLIPTVIPVLVFCVMVVKSL
jgi:hypothetical protein